ncbi:MAG: bacterial Ig-like domain-containing protein [Clostridia bacterium]|nr:bacterial Ig-like domain-containing protein [Clostridia bacterium]
MKKTVKKGLSLLLALIFALSIAAPAFAHDEQILVSDSASAETVLNGAIEPQAGEYLTVSNITIAADSTDPTGIIEVRINNTGSGTYGINWEFRTDNGRVIDPPQIYDKGVGSGYRWFKLKATAVQGGTVTFPIYAYYNTSDNIIATTNCTVTVTVPTLTVSPSDIVIDLNKSNSATVNAVISNHTTNTLDIGYAVSNNNISASYGNYITNGTEIVVTGNTPGTYYLYTYIRNPYSGYNIVSQSHRVTVKAARALSSISVDTYPNKTTYYVGESFSSSGMVVRANYNDGTSEYITSGFTCSSPDMSTAGRKNVKVTYGGKTTSFYITVNAKPAATLSSISIRTNPSKMTYNVGESFNSSGLSLNVYYSDGTSKSVTSGFTCSKPDMSTAGTKKVTVTYKGKTASFNITVKAKPATVTLSSISVKTYPSKTTYNVGESFSSSGLTLNAKYSDGSTKTITSGFTCSKPDMSTAGIKSVTVTYQGKTTSFNITVKSNVVKATSVEIIVEKDFNGTSVAELGAQVNPSNASYKSLVWSSADPRIATVDADGTVTTVSSGITIVTVTVTNHDGSTVSDTIEVEVVDNSSSGGGIFDFIIAIFELLFLPFTLLFSILFG